MRRAVLLVGLCAASCGKEPSTAVDAGRSPWPDIGRRADAAATDSKSADSLGPRADALSPKTQCSGLATPPQRDYAVELVHKGLKRQALVHLPPGYDPTKPTPLVLNLHGNMMTASLQKGLSKFDTVADARGLITVSPDGTGAPVGGWNVGKSPLGYLYEKVDDVGFLATLMDELARQLCVDGRRVYCVGFSLGGSMCYRLAFELSDRIAAFVSVAGPDAHPEPTNPKRALPMLHIHGTADSFAYYEGGKQENNKGAEKVVADYASRFGCSMAAKVTLQKGDTTCKSYEACADGATATLCTVKDGGHSWPGGTPWMLGGKTSTDIDASTLAADLFAKVSLP